MLEKTKADPVTVKTRSQFGILTPSLVVTESSIEVTNPNGEQFLAGSRKSERGSFIVIEIGPAMVLDMKREADGQTYIEIRRGGEYKNANQQ